MRNQDGKAYFFLTNAYDYPINIEILVIKLISVESFNEILWLETQSEDKIYKTKESENIVFKTDKNKKNPSSHDNDKNGKNLGNHNVKK